MSVLHKSICSLNEIPIKTAAEFFLEIDRMIVKCMWKCRGLRMAKAISKKTKFGGLNTTRFQDLLLTHSNQDSVILTYQIDQWKRALRNRPAFMAFLTKAPKQSNREKKVFSTNSAEITEYIHMEKK